MLYAEPMEAEDNRFPDRTDAGRQLAARLVDMKLDHPQVYALPRGGVPVAVEIAAALKAPLDLILVRKIGAPGNPELALGAIAEGPDTEVIVNEDVWMSTRAEPIYFNEEKVRQQEELARRAAAYLGDRPRLDPAGKTVVVVDDGLATGATMKAALSALARRKARRLILALPVAPKDTLHVFADLADDIICLNPATTFRGVGAFYQNFDQLTDAEVVALLDRAPAQ